MNYDHFNLQISSECLIEIVMYINQGSTQKGILWQREKIETGFDKWTRQRQELAYSPI